jgi:hypothetical protein
MLSSLLSIGVEVMPHIFSDGSMGLGYEKTILFDVIIPADYGKSDFYTLVTL